jgi:hypothetical protein
MGLAILLSIIQKNRSGGEAENEITALNNISKQLEKLNPIDTNIKSLSSNVSSKTTKTLTKR